ncbi:hypothetical protein MAPG_09437 [Magnaporthiopsis poae ATCC 64411]|uniref:DUF4232 domain-containing protein n=1 Tax=Magnaporthiopsis poae (strain ATCC 64411 / 73-15) TaxID=644358 RepID=A0A0C4E9Y5_MAGP6|nr:hypothetical protein MAPG_09437 [Magnaporthiopsis poae ATCC 64411]
MQTPSLVAASRLVLALLASSAIAAPLTIGTTTSTTTGDLVARDGLSEGCPPGYGNGCSHAAAKIEARSPLLGMKKKKKQPVTAKPPPVQASACKIVVSPGTGPSFNVRAKPNAQTTLSSAGVQYTLKTSPTCEVIGELPDGFTAKGDVDGWITTNPSSNRPNNQFDNRREGKRRRETKRFPATTTAAGDFQERRVRKTYLGACTLELQELRLFFVEGNEVKTSAADARKEFGWGP